MHINLKNLMAKGMITVTEIHKKDAINGGKNKGRKVNCHCRK